MNEPLRFKDWYNGYRFSPDSEQKVYNPCSVLKCLEKKKFDNYWSQTGTPSFLVKLLKEKDYPALELENLTLSEKDLGTFDIEQLKLPTLLFQAGYLTIKDYDVESSLYKLSYPNQEVSRSMIEMIAPMMTGQDSFRTLLSDRVLHAGEVHGRRNYDGRKDEHWSN